MAGSATYKQSIKQYETVLSFKVSLFIPFIQAWKRRECVYFVCLALKLFQLKFPKTTQCSFKRRRHKQRAYFTVWFRSQIHCAETERRKLPLFFPVISGLPWDENGSGDCGKWQMRLGRAIEEVICHHGSHTPFEQGPRWGGGGGSHTTWRDEAWEMQLTDSAHLSV